MDVEKLGDEEVEVEKLGCELKFGEVELEFPTPIIPKTTRPIAPIAQRTE